ncbi:MAG: hypothetical protein U5K54_23775 [Cytophagales bacterium]|nr:hypothetical protein [Cytophagales bacterium]
MTPVLEAYNMGVKEHGEEFMRVRFETICSSIVKECLFRTGLFENPLFECRRNSKSIVGKADFMKARL